MKSYLNALRNKNRHCGKLTKVTKAPSVGFVSTPDSHIPKNECIEDASYHGHCGSSPAPDVIEPEQYVKVESSDHALKNENTHSGELTKVTKAASVGFVSTPDSHISKNECIEDATYHGHCQSCPGECVPREPEQYVKVESSEHLGGVICLYCRHCGYVDVTFGRIDQICVCTLSGKRLVGISRVRRCQRFSVRVVA